MKNFYRTYGKRGVDVLVAMMLGIFSLWLMVLIVMWYYVSLTGKPFFIQERVGKDGVPFRLYKFRTLMADTTKPLHERRFAWGNFLRFTNLDELPQLYNIIIGDMSFVGPRPLPVEYFPFYSAEQQKRHSVKPGLTGWAQVNGRHSISWAAKFELDLYYVKNLSLRLDLRILFKTIRLLLAFKKDVSLNEEKFTGNA